MKNTYSTPLSLSRGGWLLLLVLLFAAGCKKDEPFNPELGFPQDHPADVALAWNRLYLDLERYTPGYRPPVSARTAGYVGLAAYEAVQPGMDFAYNSMDKHFPGLQLPEVEKGADYHWPTVATAAYAHSLELFFLTAPDAQRNRIEALKDELVDGFRADVPKAVIDRSLERGREVAQAVYDWSAEDEAGHRAYLRNTDPSYVPPRGPGLWQPTYPDFSAPLLPYWGEVRTFAAGNDDVCPAPLPYSEDPNSEIHHQALEVYHMVDSVVLGLAPEYKWIAYFWSDDCAALTFTPAGRWISVANQVVEQEEVSLALALETYARVGMALSDAGVRAWHEKYRYNYLRPIDYIREVKKDLDWNAIMCPDASGNYYTPNFPAYPSGHATFGAAACEVLSQLYGFNYSFTDRSHEGRTEFDSQPRTFRSFYDMARENGFSRLPMGVHFRMDSDAGIDLGFRIGEKVNRLGWRR